MIVDLATGAVHYEGLFATQDLSSQRYNTDEYKTVKMVLRKVPATAKSFMLPNGPFADGYYTGSDTVSYNMPKKWTTDRDYYIDIYPVTRRQYELVGADAVNDASETEVTGNIIPHRPAVRTAWSELRTDIASTSSIPVVASANTGTFFQRLCCKTGNKYSFDLPTDLMFNLAARAGVTTTYFWGDTADSSKVVCSANSGGKRVAVGSKGANAWGLYDVNGDVWERARDTYSEAA
jgi:formylglycine-generating enzyme required for sulfatase activity